MSAAALCCSHGSLHGALTRMKLVREGAPLKDWKALCTLDVMGRPRDSSHYCSRWEEPRPAVLSSHSHQRIYIQLIYIPLYFHFSAAVPSFPLWNPSVFFHGGCGLFPCTTGKLSPQRPKPIQVFLKAASPLSSSNSNLTFITTWASCLLCSHVMKGLTWALQSQQQHQEEETSRVVN